MDLLAGDAVQRLVADDHKQKSFQRKFLHQAVPVFPNVQHRVLYDVLRHGEGYPARGEAAQPLVIESVACFETLPVPGVEPSDDQSVVEDVVFGVQGHKPSYLA